MINKKEHSDKPAAKQAAEEVTAEPNKIRASTPYDFEAKNLTAYGGLLPVVTMLEKLGFRQLVEETLTVKRITRAMPMYQFVLAMVLAIYVGFSRLHHLRFLEREPMLTGSDGHSEGVAAAATVHLLTVSGIAASGGGAATAGGAAAHAGTGVGRGPCPIVDGDGGYRHDRCIRCSATRWAGARVTTPRTRPRRAISVCPAKAGVFSGSQPHQDKSQSSVAGIAGREGN